MNIDVIIMLQCMTLMILLLTQCTEFSERLTILTMILKQVFNAITDSDTLTVIRGLLVATVIAVFIGITMAFINYWRYANNHIHYADKYIQELEETLELNGISIDDTVGSGDTYESYYNSLKGQSYE